MLHATKTSLVSKNKTLMNRAVTKKLIRSSGRQRFHLYQRLGQRQRVNAQIAQVIQFSLLLKRSFIGDCVSLTEQMISIDAIAKSSIDVIVLIYLNRKQQFPLQPRLGGKRIVHFGLRSCTVKNGFLKIHVFFQNDNFLCATGVKKNSVETEK